MSNFLVHMWINDYLFLTIAGCLYDEGSSHAYIYFYLCVVAFRLIILIINVYSYQ